MLTETDKRRVAVRFVLGLFVIIAWVFYNIYASLSYQHGIREIDAKDICINGVAVLGSFLCAFIRFWLHGLEIIRTKNKGYRIFMTIYQLLCGLCYVFLVSKALSITRGQIQWIYLRIYLECLYALVLIIIMQFSGYVVGVAIQYFSAGWKKENGNRRYGIARLIVFLVISFVWISILGRDLYRVLFYSIDKLARLDVGIVLGISYYG